MSAVGERARRGRAAQASATVAAGALAGALVLRAVALAAGGGDLRAGMSGATTAAVVVVTAVAVAPLGHRWARLRWPATAALVDITCPPRSPSH
jgi:membrane protein YdbS with pleckstrin-like domain